MRATAKSLVVAALLFGGPAFGASADPPPPGSETPPGSDNEKPPLAGEKPPGSDGAAPAPKEREGRFALGVRGRYISVPGFMLDPFLAAHTELHSGSFGIEFVNRRQAFDVIVALDMSFLPVKDGNFLGAGKDPALDNHYTQFRDLSFLSLDVGIIGHVALTNRVELRYGGGLGLGVVFGDVYLTNNSDQVCNAGNARDTNACYPISPSGGPIRIGQPDTETKLQQTDTIDASADVAQDPHRHKAQEKPPVMGVLNLQLGVRFKIHRHLGMKIEGGFRNAFFVGGGFEYVF